MHTINFTGTSGQQLTIILTTEEYERGLARAQQGSSGTVSETLKSQGQFLREIGGDPCHPNALTKPHDHEAG
tara:strand:+ start:311 stop:526 length:216 start_codon:yes stop_codon:yes gene_type:complete